MDLSSIKDGLGLGITSLAGSLTFILNKLRKGEKLTLIQHLAHLFISGFVGYLAFLGCDYFGIESSVQGIIIGICSYSGITIIDSYDKVKEKFADSLISKAIDKVGK